MLVINCIVDEILRDSGILRVSFIPAQVGHICLVCICNENPEKEEWVCYNDSHREVMALGYLSGFTPAGRIRRETPLSFLQTMQIEKQRPQSRRG